jgi:hypothetical protein
MKGLIVSKERKPGWEYYTSKKLNLNFAIHKATGWVYFSDGTRYSPEEIALLNKNNAKMTEELHRVKKIFQGEIIGVVNEFGTRTTDKRKSVESGGTNNTNNNSTSGRKIPETPGIGPQVQSGELEIY